MPFVLSTSQSPNLFYEYGCHIDLDKSYGGFGPTADDGYGVGYCVLGDEQSKWSLLSLNCLVSLLVTRVSCGSCLSVNFQISSWSRCIERNSVRFGQHIIDAFEQVKQLFAN